MNFTTSLVADLADKHLLKHPWYQKWSDGTVPKEAIRMYARQYYHHVRAFPRYISATHSNCDNIEARQILLENLIDEEQGPGNHPELWLQFAEGLGQDRESVKCEELFPETQELIDTFMGFSRGSYLDGLAALFAYEQQVPEVAHFKIEALKEHYDTHDEATLKFFEVHKKADVYHREAVSKILEDLTEEEQAQVQKTARVAADQLWKFLDGINRRTNFQ